jgi:hypothetical protein
MSDKIAKRNQGPGFGWRSVELSKYQGGSNQIRPDQGKSSHSETIFLCRNQAPAGESGLKLRSGLESRACRAVAARRGKPIRQNINLGNIWMDYVQRL